jgi:hypothetical protein
MKDILKGVALLVLMVGFMCLVMAACAGCDMYTAKTVAGMDNNALASRLIASQAEANQLTPASMAYYLENDARAFQNLSDAGHWRQPTFATAPTNRPTTLPWAPIGGTTAEANQK